MNRTARSVGASAGRTALLFVVLFAASALTRAPAWWFPQLYALHGVLAAPLYAAALRWHFGNGGRMGAPLVAVAAQAALLGAMSEVMGLGFVLLAACLLVASAATKGMDADRAGFVRSAVFGAAAYPCALASGVVLGSYAFSDWGTVVLLAVLAAALALLGAALFSKTSKPADDGRG